MRYDRIVEKAREVVGRHALPDFVSFKVWLSEFDGDPAMCIEFKTLPEPPFGRPAFQQQVVGISALVAAVQPNLLEVFEDRLPYFRFETDRELKPVAE